MTGLSLFAVSALAPFFWGVPTEAPALAAAAAAEPVVAAVSTVTVNAGATAAAGTTDEQQFVDLINQERRSRGLAPLTIDSTLSATARDYSRSMSDLSFFSHESPVSGMRTPMDRYMSTCRRLGSGRDARPQYLLVGENIFYCSKPGVDRGHRAFMESEGHRRNILDARYEAVGIGTYTNARGEYFVTELFMKRR